MNQYSAATASDGCYVAYEELPIRIPYVNMYLQHRGHITYVVLNFRTPILDNPNNLAFGEASIDDLPVTGPSHVDE
jgi:hypothetical protein